MTDYSCKNSEHFPCDRVILSINDKTQSTLQMRLARPHPHLSSQPELVGSVRQLTNPSSLLFWASKRPTKLCWDEVVPSPSTPARPVQNPGLKKPKPGQSIALLCGNIIIAKTCLFNFSRYQLHDPTQSKITIIKTLLSLFFHLSEEHHHTQFYSEELSFLVRVNDTV